MAAACISVCVFVCVCAREREKKKVMGNKIEKSVWGQLVIGLK